MADWRAGLAVVALGAAAVCAGPAPARAGLLGEAVHRPLLDQKPLPAVDSDPSLVAYPLRWCVQGATVTLVFSAVLSAPAVVTGLGAPLGAVELATAAGTGCAFGVAWGATLTGMQWVGNQVLWLYAGEGPAPRLVAISAGG